MNVELKSVGEKMCMVAVALLISILESLFTAVPYYKRKVRDILLVILRSVLNILSALLWASSVDAWI